jgi:hypothetical protein
VVSHELFVRLGYPPDIIYSRDRNRYHKALGGPTPAIPALLASSLPVPLRTALRAAIERERLKVQRAPTDGGESTRAWVDEFLETKYKRQ